MFVAVFLSLSLSLIPSHIVYVRGAEIRPARSGQLDVRGPKI